MSLARRELPPFVDYVVLPAVNVITAFAAAGLVVLAIGENPIEVVKIMIVGALGNAENIGYTLYYTTNFIFTGLSVAVAYHAGLFNIGPEGQSTVAGIGVALVCLAFDGAPWWLVLPFAVAASVIFGAGWALIPAWLQARRGSHIVITTIMFNFLAATLIVYLLVNVMGKAGSMATETRMLTDATRLPFFATLLKPFGIDLGQSPVNPSFLIAIVASVAVWLLVWHTRLGYEIRTVGTNSQAAVYAGIDPARIIIIAMLISGGLSGLLAVNEVMAVQGRLLIDVAQGAGFVGIAVALMGRSHPLGIALAAFLFGILYQGGAELGFDIPKITRDMIVVIQALVILFAGALGNMYRPMLERIFARRPAARAHEAEA
ncbi:MAG: ABC transporter permease [Ancalomicrobiaceae bacterium]|nr:ABC transporter permease [Ancalomicrobiaceae bacterium]